MSSARKNEADDFEDEEDFVLLDDAGCVVEPSEEESCVMAALYGTEVVDDPDRQWYVDEFAKGQAHIATNPQLMEMLRQATADDIDDDDSDSEELDAEQQQESGMIPAADESFSREFSDHPAGSDQPDDDEWTLERILKRRRVKFASPTAVGSSSDPEEAPPLPYEYLCKWKWYAEPTWEPRVLLEDEGFGREVVAFDLAKEPRARSKAMRPRKPRPAALDTKLEDFYPDTLGSVRSLYRSHGMDIARYAAVNNKSLTDRFVRAWAQRSKDHCPAILFHGTRSTNIRSICHSGLMVPGRSGVKVLNGSAYGVGIYTAKNPGYSTSYTNCDLMFVCLGLVGPQIKTLKDVGQICVFFEEQLVVPMWVVQFTRTKSSSSAGEPQRVSLSEILKAVPENRGGNQPILSAMSGPSVDAVTSRKPLTKKMIKQAPRSFKELYKQGLLHQKKS
jgi:hypothetical protein